MKLGPLTLSVLFGYASARFAAEAFRSDSVSGPLGDLGFTMGKVRLPDSDVKVGTRNIKSIDERVSYITKMIKKGRYHPSIRQLATQIVSRKCEDTWCVAEKDYMGELRAVFNFVRSNVRYVRDPWNRDTFQAPHRTLEWSAADCDDYTILLGSLLQAIGYPVASRVVMTKSHNDWNHIYLMAGTPPMNPKKWVALDASVPMHAGWEVPRSMLAREPKDFPVT